MFLLIHLYIAVYRTMVRFCRKSRILCATFVNNIMKSYLMHHDLHVACMDYPEKAADIMLLALALLYIIDCRFLLHVFFYARLEVIMSQNKLQNYKDWIYMFISVLFVWSTHKICRYRKRKHTKTKAVVYNLFRVKQSSYFQGVRPRKIVNMYCITLEKFTSAYQWTLINFELL